MRSDDRLAITILGATGSIGVNTLDVVARHPDRFLVYALSAHRNINLLVEQCVQHRPKLAVVHDAVAADATRARLRELDVATEVLHGAQALEDIASAADVDCVMAAIVGGAGLMPTLAAARAGKRVLLANKEALVMAGQLFMAEVKRYGAELLPIDSEHNAIFQCMPSGYRCGASAAGIRRLLLTASGGPFRQAPIETLRDVTPDQACAHPNWVMGRKISVDSATMMNKGLEVIEACWLFALGVDAIEVVIHPQSVVHSMVEYIDGSVLAQLGQPDMRTPIANALAWPNRIAAGVGSLSLAQLSRLEFEAPDLRRFPCLQLAHQAAQAGQTACIVLNAANEIAVAAFLAGELSFIEIGHVIDDGLNAVGLANPQSIDDVLHVDAVARRAARESIARLREE